jgi:formylmethanofuran--tetrahydromethanopterin N-formyltransferase
MMDRRGVRIVDTFAEAFDMRAARVLITAHTPAWARTAAESMTGFATSVIGCKVEAGIEADLRAQETPDGRPGASVLLFAFDAAGLGSRLIERVGQTVLTCPTTACFDACPRRPSGRSSADSCATSAIASSPASSWTVTATGGSR